MFDGGNPLIELCSEEMEAPAALLNQLFHLPAASVEVSLDRKYCTRLMGSRMCNPPSFLVTLPSPHRCLVNFMAVPCYSVYVPLI